jgi:hypothetical protein
MKALIELTCQAHQTPKGQGPLITLIDGAWAYCEGHASGSHEWARIEPIRRDRIDVVSQTQERRAS